MKAEHEHVREGGKGGREVGEGRRGREVYTHILDQVSSYYKISASLAT